MPTGSLVQIVQFSTTSTITTTSTSLVATSFIGSITPQFSTSKILVMINGGHSDYTAGNASGSSTLYRQIASGGYSSLGYSNIFDVLVSGTSYGWARSLSFLDSPATTSTINYQPYISTNTNTYYYNISPVLMTMTLMEIR